MSNSKIPGTKITVIIRDDSPMIQCEDSPSYRRITFDLTKEQQEMIRLKTTSSVAGMPIFEAVSKVFIED